MFRIVRRQALCESVKLFEIEAPFIAKKAEPGQFIILRINEQGERIPFTIAGYDRKSGTITIIIQEVGKTTKQLGNLNEGEFFLDVVGPLGTPSELEGYKKVVVIGGGLGCAIAYPQAKKLYELGTEVDIIAGFRTKDLVILEDEMKSCCKRLHICTDDGSYGQSGFVTTVLGRLLNDPGKFDCAIAVGPLQMMKFVAKLTKSYELKTIVSMNPIMIDGTGMCGGCRIKVGGKIKFACVDGPDFDGHEVDYDETARRLTSYKIQEKQAMDHYCNLLNI